MLASGTLGTEDDSFEPEGLGALRGPSEALALSLGGIVIRLAPTVHGSGENGFLPTLVGIARKQGFSAYVGDGAARWPGVSRTDAAHLYVLALEKGKPGSRYHAAGEQGVPTKLIAEAIGKGLGVPVMSKTPQEAGLMFGFLAMVLGKDNPTSSEKTRSELGWVPEGPGIIAEVEAGHYFIESTKEAIA